jgi:phospholipase C
VADRQQFTVSFEARDKQFGTSAAGCPFAAYARLKSGQLQTRNYAVAAGDRLNDSWLLAQFEDEQYNLAVYGPNGFYREFRGDANGPLLEIACVPIVQRANEGSIPVVRFTIANLEKHSLTLKLMDQAYAVKDRHVALAPEETKAIDLPCNRSHGWYDIEVQLSERKLFYYRYAGRIETGIASISDPVMAGRT